MFNIVIETDPGRLYEDINTYKLEKAMNEKKYNKLQMIKILNKHDSCDSLSCSENPAFSNNNCPLEEHNCDSECISDILEYEYNGTGMNNQDCPEWLLSCLNAGIHCSVKWQKGPKTLHGKCVAVIDRLAVVVSKKDPSKVVTVSVDRLHEFT